MFFSQVLIHIRPYNAHVTSFREQKVDRVQACFKLLQHSHRHKRFPWRLAVQCNMLMHRTASEAVPASCFKQIETPTLNTSCRMLSEVVTITIHHARIHFRFAFEVPCFCTAGLARCSGLIGFLYPAWSLPLLGACRVSDTAHQIAGGRGSASRLRLPVPARGSDISSIRRCGGVMAVPLVQRRMPSSQVPRGSACVMPIAISCLLVGSGELGRSICIHGAHIFCHLTLLRLDFCRLVDTGRVGTKHVETKSPPANTQHPTIDAVVSSYCTSTVSETIQGESCASSTSAGRVSVPWLVTVDAGTSLAVSGPMVSASSFFLFRLFEPAVKTRISHGPLMVWFHGCCCCCRRGTVVCVLHAGRIRSHIVARINQISPLFDNSLRFSASVELLEPSSQRVS